jgi:hypothetical protein
MIVLQVLLIRRGPSERHISCFIKGVDVILEYLCGLDFFTFHHPWVVMSNFDWKHGLSAMDQEERSFLRSSICCCSEAPEDGG